MTLPCVFHDVFIAVMDTLAEAIEGEVGSVLWILRMFETNLQRVFLKFERFSSLRKRCRVAPHFAQRRDRRDKVHAKLRRCRGLIHVRKVRARPSRRHHSATGRSPFRSIPRVGPCVFALTGGAGRMLGFLLSVRLSRL
jgi:hypothetical protein